MEGAMSERINVGTTAYAVGSAIQAGTAAAVASIRYDRAIAREADALARFDSVVRDDARAAVARRNLRFLLGL